MFSPSDPRQSPKQNPYQAPQHNPYQAPQYAYGHGGYGQYRYEPLGWKTTAAAVGIIAGVVLGLVLNVLPMAMNGPPQDDLGLALLLGLVGLISSAISIGTIVVFLVWMHQAAKNVRAFGQQGLEFTPGWAVGWWFVPIASLWMPYRAMKEIWKASDPETVGDGSGAAWMARAVPSLLPLWWATYVANGVVAGGLAVVQVLSTLHDPTKPNFGGGPIGIGAHVLIIIAAVAIVSIMKQIAQRQDASAQRLQSV